MKKSIKAILYFFGISLFVFFCCSPVVYAVDGSKQRNKPYNGHLCEETIAPDGTKTKKQVCANCHIPHGGKGIRIWAQTGKDDISKKQTVEVKDLCASCHYKGNPSFPGIESGLYEGDDQWCENGNSEKNNKNGNVFMLGADDSADHVMGDYIKTSPSANGSFASNKAEFKGFPFSNNKFYCGSCHNPHKQPGKDESGNGDYLRLNNESNSAGTTHDRKPFCRQCHPQHSITKGSDGKSLANIHPDKSDPEDCDSCHRPHDGFPDPDPEVAASIFIDPLPDLGVFGFQVKTTLTRNSGSANTNVSPYESAKCTSCHLSKDVWLDAPKLSDKHAHHPIGNTWKNTSCYTCHDKPLISGKTISLDGFDSNGNPITNQIFGCTSCHGSHSTGIEKNPSFLLYASFEDDDTAFCEYCHRCGKSFHPKDKTLLMANGGKHFKLGGSKAESTNRIKRTFKETNKRKEKAVQCGGCMFCHFIHQNEKDDPSIPGLTAAADRVIKTASDASRADIRALMRVPAVALDWGTQGASGQGEVSLLSPLDRYESMCYGCHSNRGIVFDSGKNGSLLNPAAAHSHRFSCKPVTENTRNNIIPAQAADIQKFPLADGKPGAPGGVLDDYGTVAGQIYCGTCHDVHINSKPPYLYRLSTADKASPYQSDPITSTFTSQADRSGFCEQCHCSTNGSDPMAVKSSHPVGIKVDGKPTIPVVPHTGTEFPDLFAGGGSGSPFGITSGSNTLNGIPSGGTTKDGVLCLTCHNVHAAATTWDGAIKSEIRPAVNSTGTKTGKHGQLLVMDNYSREPGSTMCQACHVKYGDEKP